MYGETSSETSSKGMERSQRSRTFRAAGAFGTVRRKELRGSPTSSICWRRQSDGAFPNAISPDRNHLRAQDPSPASAERVISNLACGGAGARALGRWRLRGRDEQGAALG